MKSQKRSSRAWITILMLAGVAGLLIIVLIVFLRINNLNAVAAATPPTVIINAPAAGESTPAGSFPFASVTAAAQNPIARVEFWLDGLLYETQTPSVDLGKVTTFGASTNIQISEGLHMLSVRAIDTSGLVGQTLPINVLGNPPLNEETGDVSQPPPAGENPPPASSSQGQTNPGGSLGSPSSPGQPPTGPAPQPPVAILPPAPLPVTPPGMIKLQPLGSQPLQITNILPLSLVSKPNAPTTLLAGHENCTVRLTWIDNAQDETHFNVWMQALGGPAKIIATLQGSPQTGPAWYEFGSPQAGMYSFWVEAVNALGGQPSEIAWIGWNDINCTSGVATHLSIEMEDLFVNGGYDRVYCYLSIEGAPEKRIPVNDAQFIQLLGGWGDVTNWTGSGNTLLLPEPQDAEVSLAGKCLGWQGGNGPDNLGTFSVSAPKETWDSRRLELKGAGFIAGVRIQPHGAQTANGFFKYTDFTLPTPSQPLITTRTSSNAVENERLARRPTLKWAWMGDPGILTGFTIFLDGQFFRSVPNWQGGTPGRWEETFLLPSPCGGTYTFQVAANSGEAQSPPSTPYIYNQPPCEYYAEVTFESVTFTELDDGQIGSCDTVELAYSYLYIMSPSVSPSERNKIDLDNMDVECGTSYFSRMVNRNEPTGNIFVVPVDPNNAWFKIRVYLGDGEFFRHLSDDLCIISHDHPLSPHLPNWDTYFETINLDCGSGYDGTGFVTITIKGIVGPGSRP